MGMPVQDQVGSEMIVYVAEISGRGIAAFDAANDIEAQAQLANRGLLRDLIVLQNEGRALWDGVAEIHVRTATPEETEIWQTSRAAAVQSGEDSDDEGRHVFLVPVVDPSHDKFDVDDDTHDDDDRDGD
ncbi:hypothetical protein GOA77_07230 [Sinorhizobium meliloti]|uniref:Uncharacterized protein n=1 Tax=Rhizobium meliloti TaxID=382 RepID=A0A6A7ZHV5_RHIML|nr:hypothetical protein [Sinorhizobium meliloti]MDW9681879.1 hypothetical protein [Sinorhizobium meliloti]MDW9692679.1 hypothetical protein [Sinorhizobium meliloti]MDW9717542.1 hypothetical protein [Sinorhizobium meliloti]MDW9738213.1 hypothetical protein [Sinorhizobium meliloti]MDW9754729.1 hypothetical protein [Sinorhizobium meliloti]